MPKKKQDLHLLLLAYSPSQAYANYLKGVVYMNLEIENKRLIEELRAAALLIEFLKEEVHNLGQSSTVDNTNEVIQSDSLNL